jgi:phosphoserine / homoserine phosphotransferase
MTIVCLDLEGVLVPEIWINFAEETKIEELRLTTRDVPDYDVLMRRRLEILAEHDLTLDDIQTVIGRMDPLPGGLSFLDKLRERGQVIILSDTFTQFATPLMKKLGWPTLFCNSLVVDDEGYIVDYTLRQKDGKKNAVKALRSIGYRVIASGDSYNDLTMLREADAGVLFRPPETIATENPMFPAVDDHDGLFREIIAVWK